MGKVLERQTRGGPKKAAGELHRSETWKQREPSGDKGVAIAPHTEVGLGVDNDSDQVQIQTRTEVRVWEGEQKEIKVEKKAEAITWGQWGTSRQRPMTTAQGGRPGKSPAGQNQKVFALFVTIGSTVWKIPKCHRRLVGTMCIWWWLGFRVALKLLTVPSHPLSHVDSKSSSGPQGVARGWKRASGTC